ncbi:hypothetical protein HPB48_008432 [Haemaphysalis longicornis]|uniref:Gustatory receptor n=1 Tax=Haemaphysalis longicornis TaxID=44386 RepID=A0A9J6H0Q9_HAELO|nr:hypothetical protein HPB48_008432 [Haemaphysalis longicornis]
MLHQEALRDLVTRFHSIFEGSLEVHTRLLARFTKFFTSFCVACSVVLWIALSASAFGVHQHDAFPAQYYRGDSSSVPKPVQGIVVLVDTVLLTLSKSVSSLTIVFFVALCYMLSHVTLRFRLAVESASARVESGYAEARVMEGLLLRLSLISDAVHALNHTYGTMLSLWYADLTASFLFCVPSSILGVAGDAELPEYGFVLVDITRDAAVFAILTFGASNVAKNVSDSLGYALKMVNSKEDRGFAFGIIVKNLVCHLQDARVQLSGAEFFEVDRALINKVLSLVATFAIILYQFLS